MNRWKIMVAALMVGVLSLTVATPALAASDSMDMDDCTQGATLASLHQCLTHAQAMGHITNPVIANRLHSFLDQADAASARGLEGATDGWLRNFIRLVQNEAGRGQIEHHAAMHLIEHAAMIIDAPPYAGR